MGGRGKAIGMVKGEDGESTSGCSELYQDGPGILSG